MEKVETMADVRREIDRVDELLVPLLLERLEYIKAAGYIKVDRETVRDNWRIEDVISKVKDSAVKSDGNAEYIEDIFRHLIEWSIRYEFDVWDGK